MRHGCRLPPKPPKGVRIPFDDVFRMFAAEPVEEVQPCHVFPGFFGVIARLAVLDQVLRHPLCDLLECFARLAFEVRSEGLFFGLRSIPAANWSARTST